MTQKSSPVYYTITDPNNDYTFSLKANSLGNPKLDVVCSYAPFYTNENNRAVKYSVTPKVMGLKNQYINTFCLEIQEVDFIPIKPTNPRNIISSAIVYRKLIEQEQESSQIYVPMPQSTFCKICNVEYANYFDHIAEIEHRTKQSRGHSTDYIRSLCSKYGNSLLKVQKPSSSKKPSEDQVITLDEHKEDPETKYLLQNFEKNDDLLKDS